MRIKTESECLAESYKNYMGNEKQAGSLVKDTEIGTGPSISAINFAITFHYPALL